MQIEVTRRRDAVLIERVIVTLPDYVSPEDFGDDDLAEMFKEHTVSEEFDIDEPYLAIYEVAEA